MTAENTPELFLGLQNNPETVRKWPLYASVNNLFEQIFSLNHVVGSSETSQNGFWNCELASKELQVLLLTLLEDENRMRWNYNTQENVRQLLSGVGGDSPKYAGFLARHITEDSSLIQFELINQALNSGNEMGKVPFSVRFLKKSQSGRLIVAMDHKEVLYDPNPDIYNYRGILEGFKRILDTRKKLNVYLQASA